MKNKKKTLLSVKTVVIAIVLLTVISTILIYHRKTESNVYGNVYVVLPGTERKNELPVLSIVTVNGEEPSFSEAEKPENADGRGITNNEYVHGTLSVVANNILICEMEMKFKIRGNTSAFQEKKKYKVVLNEETDLLFRGKSSYKDKIWVLCSMDDLKTPVGSYVSSTLGMEWQPAFAIVNLEINGNSKGCYLLMENVNKSDERLNITETGVIFENDAYWWIPDTQYFRTDNQNYNNAYTIKYPTKNSEKIAIIPELKDYIQEFEEALYSDSESYVDYIDFDSFVTWLMIHDVLGTYDASGSNMFFSINSLSSEDELKKIKAGPVWDFDSIFITKDEWAVIHAYYPYYYLKLSEYEIFVDAYKEKWEKFSYKLENGISDYIAYIVEAQGKAIQNTYDSENGKINGSDHSLENQMKEVDNWFSQRIEWMNAKVPALSPQDDHLAPDVPSIGIEGTTIKIKYYDADKYDELWAAVWSVEDDQDDLIWYQAEKSEKIWHFTIDLNNHKDNGEYIIHFFYIDGETSEKVICNYITVNVDNLFIDK